MRIIGGRFRGKRLQSPADRSIRPTADRARESLFNILDHQGLIVGARFLDLFCGTGAVGLEAYSRGAAEVWLMDRDVDLATANVRAFDTPATVRVCDQRALAREKPGQRFDIAFLDPPYQQGLLEPTLSTLRHGWLAQTSWIVVERAAKEPFSLPEGFFVRQERRYGRTGMIFLGLGDPSQEDR